MNALNKNTPEQLSTEFYDIKQQIKEIKQEVEKGETNIEQKIKNIQDRIQQYAQLDMNKKNVTLLKEQLNNLKKGVETLSKDIEKGTKKNLGDLKSGIKERRSTKSIATPTTYGTTRPKEVQTNIQKYGERAKTNVISMKVKNPKNFITRGRNTFIDRTTS